MGGYFTLYKAFACNYGYTFGGNWVMEGGGVP
jgi:hypothetical protein